MNTTLNASTEWKAPHIKLFYAPICPWSQRVRMVAAEMNLPLELVVVPMSNSGEFPEWFTAINPRRMVPTVQISFPEDPSRVETVAESMVICRLLIGIGKPGSRCLLPENPLLKYEVDWFCDEADRTINDLYHYSMMDNEEVKQAALDSLDRLEALLEKNGGPFVLGNNFSLAECCFSPFFERMVYIIMNFNQGNLLLGRPRLAAFHKGCRLQPSFLANIPPQNMVNETYMKFIPRPFNPPPMKLYCNPMCPFSQRVHICLKLLGLSFDLVHVDLPHLPAWYKKVNPHGMLPTLELATGERLFDSILITKYLVANFPSPVPLLQPLGRESPLTKAKIDFFLDELEKKIKIFILFRAQNHTINLEAMAPDEMPVEVQAGLAAIAGHVEEIEDLLVRQHPTGPFFLGDEFSYADVTATPIFAHFLSLMHTSGHLSPTFCIRMQTLHAAVRSLDGVDEILRCMVNHHHELIAKGKLNPHTSPDIPRFTPHSIEHPDENGATWASGKFKNWGQNGADRACEEGE